LGNPSGRNNRMTKAREGNAGPSAAASGLRSGC